MTARPPVPTLNDVALRAGVSTATVSRCLNAPDRVSAATRDRVLGAVSELGYTPNFGARAMAAKRTHTIGAIIPTMENAIFARGLQAFQEELHALGYTLLVSSSGYDPDLEAEQVRALVARGADGLLLIGYDRSADIYGYLKTRGVPALVAWSYAAGNPLPAIGFDNRASMQALGDAVIDRGHRHIGVISGITAGNDRAAERLAGIRDAVQARGLELDARCVIETPYSIETGAAAFETLLHPDAPHPPVTAVMCGNDVLAAGALQQAYRMGLRVPADVSITGFDDIELARIVTPQLTTVHVPHRQMGQQAATALVDMVEGRASGSAPARALPSTVMMRGTLGDARI